MLDRLISLAQQLVGLFRFAAVVNDYEAGVVLRLGHFHRKLGPGFHFMLPFGIEQVYTDNCVPSTLSLGPQSLTTRDGVSVVVSGIVTWRIHDIRKMLLEVEDAESVLTDSAYGLIGDSVRAAEWAEVQAPEFAAALTSVIRQKAFRWGIKVSAVQLSDVSRSKSLRLWKDS